MINNIRQIKVVKPFIELDEVRSVLNPVTEVDLDTILNLTLASRRVAVAMAFCGIEIELISELSGFDESNIYRWLKGKHRLPFGGAVRLSRVFGVRPELLFESLI